MLECNALSFLYHTHRATEILLIVTMASFTLGSAQLVHQKQVARCSTVQLPQAKTPSSISFGPKLGCRTRALRVVRGSGRRSFNGGEGLIVAAAGSKGYKVSSGHHLGLLEHETPRSSCQSGLTMPILPSRSVRSMICDNHAKNFPHRLIVIS